MHPSCSGGAYGRRSEVRKWRRLCVASQNHGFPHGEKDQRRFGGGSVSGRGCCRSRDNRLNGGDGGATTTRRSSALAAAGLASILGAKMVGLDVVRRQCSHGGSDVSATMAQV